MRSEKKSRQKHTKSPPLPQRRGWGEGGRGEGEEGESGREGRGREREGKGGGEGVGFGQAWEECGLWMGSLFFGSLASMTE